jgi:Ca2+:H+ antiporter
MMTADARSPLNHLLGEIRRNRLLWLLVALPPLFAVYASRPGAHTALFILAVLSVVPLAVLISYTTDSIAAKTGDTVGAFISATLGNLTELILALTALYAGQYILVKASIAGAIVTKTLFTLGLSFFVGGLKHHIQEFNAASARLQASLVFLALIALLMPSVLLEAAVGETSSRFGQSLSLTLSVLLIVCYSLSMLFSLKTHRDVFTVVQHGGAAHSLLPIGLALAVLGVVTVLVAVVCHILVDTVEPAGKAFGMTSAFIGFIIVGLVNAIAELAPALSGARKNRLDLSVGIALGGAAQITLLVTPILVLASYFIGPSPMSLQFWPSAVAVMLISALTVLLVTTGGRSAWFIGVFILNLYLIFAITLYLLPEPV